MILPWGVRMYTPPIDWENRILIGKFRGPFSKSFDSNTSERTIWASWIDYRCTKPIWGIWKQNKKNNLHICLVKLIFIPHQHNVSYEKPWFRNKKKLYIFGKYSYANAPWLYLPKLIIILFYQYIGILVRETTKRITSNSKATLSSPKGWSFDFYKHSLIWPRNMITRRTVRRDRLQYQLNMYLHINC